MNGKIRRRVLPLFAVLAAACGGAEPNDENTTETAQAVSADGPFASVAALQAYWGAQPISSCLNVYVGGSKVYSRSGFGPCYEPEYFQCKGGSLEAHCGDIATGDATKSELIGQMGNNPTVYVDGQLYEAGTGGVGSLKTCYGDPSFAGHIRYYVVTGFCAGNNGAVFGPCYPGRACY